MNLNKLIYAALAISISSHAFAMEIYKGKVISERAWSSDGRKVTLASSHPKFKPVADSGFEFIEAIISSDNAKVNTPIQLHNYSYASVTNGSTETKLYAFYQNVCSETVDGLKRCNYYHKEVELEAGGSIYEETVPMLEMTYSKPGRYRISSTSAIYDSVDQGGFIPHFSSAVASIFVS